MADNKENLDKAKEPSKDDLKTSANKADAQTTPASEDTERKQLPVLLMLMGVNILLVSFIIGVILSFNPTPQPGSQTTIEINTSAQTKPSDNPTDDPTPAKSDIVSKGLSWSKAEKAYTSKNFDTACLLYGKLFASMGGESTTKSFCSLRLGQSLRRIGKNKEASAVFEHAQNSKSSIVKAMAWYESAKMDFDEKAYMHARMKAYKAIACLRQPDKSVNLVTDCDFLIANSLAMSAAPYLDIELPKMQKNTAVRRDPFEGLDEAALKELLGHETEFSPKLKFQPNFFRTDIGSFGMKFTVSCSKIPLEELIARLSKESNEEIIWSSVKSQSRMRAVSMDLQESSFHRLCEIASGLVGMTAAFDINHVSIHDPYSCESTQKKGEILANEAISACRRFRVNHPKDQRVPHVRYSIAALVVGMGKPLEALNECRLLASQYPHNPIAPAGILMSAKIRLGIKDYFGAKKDLLDLIDRYPEHKEIAAGLLELAELYFKDNQIDKALNNFRQVYYLDSSKTIKEKAAFGAGMSFFRQKNYEKAIGWFGKFIDSTSNITGDDVAKGYFIIGKCHAAIGKPKDAVVDFHRAMKAKPDDDLRCDILLELADAYLNSDNPARTMGTLTNIAKMDLNEDQKFNCCRRKVKILRLMGMSEKALKHIDDVLKSTQNIEFRAMLKSDLAGCYEDLGEIEKAHSILTQALQEMKRSPFAQQETCRLAEMRLRMNKPKQAAVILEDMLRDTCSSAVRSKSNKLLARAYILDGKFSQAAQLIPTNSIAKVEEK